MYSNKHGNSFWCYLRVLCFSCFRYYFKVIISLAIIEIKKEQEVKLTRAGVIHCVVQNCPTHIYLDFVNNQFGKNQIPFEVNRCFVLVHHSSVHKWMRSDECEDTVR